MIKKRWSEDERRMVLEYYSILGPKKLSAMMGRSRPSLLKMAYRLGVGVPPDIKNILLSEVVRDNSGEMNGNWKGGISKNSYRYKLKSIAKHRDKHVCRLVLYNAMRAGKIIRMPCVICGEVKSEAHHEDYSKPLEVIWLCRKHHIEADKNRRMRELGTDLK